MRAAFFADKEMWVVPFLFVLFVFFIPISTTFKSVFLVLCILAVLLTPYYRRYLPLAFNSLWGLAALSLLGLTLIACFWSAAPLSKGLAVVGKYGKLLYLPIFAVGFIHPKLRHWCINAYLAAMCFTCLLSLFFYWHLITPLSDDAGKIFNNHIITGFMMAFAVYLSGLLAIQNKGWIRALYVFLSALMSYQILFINTGRTGYVVYLVLMAFLILQTLTLKKALLGVLLLGLGMTLAYFQSTTMQVKVHQLVTDVQDLQRNHLDTSLGYRIQFHRYARSLWEQHPLIGNGTGSFKESFNRDNPVPSWGRHLTDPHSQYWMILSEQGVLGFVFLMGFIISLWITSLKLKETKPIIQGLLISFCIGSFTDTILCYSTLGYLLVIMGALCFGELVEIGVWTKLHAKRRMQLCPDSN